MSDQQLYEGLFLMNIGEVGSDPAVSVGIVVELLKRANAEIMAVSKWDERKMAYEIKGQKRGLYVLALFRCKGGNIANIDRDVNLTENVLRCLIIKAEHYGDVEIEAEVERSNTTNAAYGVKLEDLLSGAPVETPVVEAPAETEAEAPAETASEEAATPAAE